MQLAGALIAAALAFAAPAQAQRLDDHTILVPGGITPGRQPDGNSILLEGPDGLVVFDTGRHKTHSDAILAATGDRRIVAIVNSHWHLDHVSGNLRLRPLFPGLRVYGTGAIDGALTGFLKTSAAQGRQALASGKLSPSIAEDVRADLLTIDRGNELRPDIQLGGVQTLKLAGRNFMLGVSLHAATAADLWLYDPASKRLLAGDLVTLPAPFLDTACPEGWADALATIDKLDFETLVPGHGPVMTHEDFRWWKNGFEDFLICSGGERPMETCAGGWLAAARHWLSEKEVADFAGYAYYYGELLRSGKLNKYCAA
ncbi:MBL fold metallo-hydrolase [Sphingomonas sp. LB-2]|uniref:MBL fold metallo-hydrolase n=1 Tax=Sphingomonas caeni TaxID=2984949 RepID=UPI0022303C39|nr:MBL fold metallo-hydrolase [Sphingomonas caeni]MCW3847230.1 MBL fold metallo-hydrolase [Sphingomonas caeni]